MFRTATANTTNAKSSNSSLFQKEKGDGAFIQPKLSIGKPGDRYEVEADKVADTVVAKGNEQSNSFFSPTPLVQKQSEEEVQQQEITENEVQQKPLVENITPLIQKQSEEEPIQQKEEQEEVQQKPEEEIQKKEVSEDTIQQKTENNSITPDIQKQEEEIQEKEEEEEDVSEVQMVQRKTNGIPNTNSSIESRLNSSKGSGAPMSKSTQVQMESGFGTNFSNVRVHTDSSAVQMSKDLGAQAFTHGNDIYFNEGKYDTSSDSGKHLLAHELTHTVQQGASVQTKMIQKVDDGPALPSSAGTPSTGLVSNTNETITYASLPVTAFKLTGGREHLYTQHNLRRHKNYTGSRVGVNQRDIWRREVDTTNIERILLEKHNQANGVETSSSGSHTIYAFKVNRSNNCYLTGTMQNVVREATTPKWDDRGRCPKYFQVDHIVEMQISGFPTDTSVNAIDNLELLERNANVNSGEVIMNSVKSKVAETLNNEESAAVLEGKISGLAGVNDIDEKVRRVKNTYDLVFNNHSAGGGPRRVGTDKYWIRSQIEMGDHLSHLVPVNMSELGSADSILVFPRRYHPVGKSFSWNGSNTTPSRRERNWFSPWEITSKTFTNDPNSDILGHFVLEFPSDDPLIRATGGTVEIKKLPGAQFAGYVDNVVDGGSAGRQSIISAGNIAAKQFSPVRLDETVFQNDSVLVRGKVLPTLGFIEEAELDLTIQNGEVQISKTFTSDNFSLPTPFELKETSLTLFASSTRGLGIEGRVDFGINNVGEGYIGAAASTSGGFELEGAFNFDSELFDPAEIQVEYKDNIWTIGGEIGIPEGKVRGVKNATITASYSEGNFTATGTAELDVPGVERGTMTVNYGDEGFSISGDFDLSSDIPGIRGGNVAATVSRTEGEEGYSIMVTGTAQPDIPGINSSLTVTYDNGALTIEGEASYSRGMLSGTINVGATNRTIGEDGEPTGEPDDTMRVYGGGSLTLQLTPWLEATAGVQFLPNGEIEVTGRIALPSTVDVFDRREMRRNLFTVPTIEIPLFAIPLGPRSLGLVAQIGGGLDFAAGVGPGQLRDVSAEVTYNPDHEDETTITGHGEFAIPADAGLTLRGDLGLGLSVAIASLSGGIEIAGTLGLEGEAAAEVDLSWSPQTGITLDAEGRITVNPKFTFDINAFARASLGVGFLSISETWRHNLVSFSWGPDIQFGIVFPVHYQEGQPFDISFDDIEVIYPDLDIIDMAGDLARDIKDDIFD